MKYITLPKTIQNEKASFYFALEEYAAQNYSQDDCFHAWTVDPSVLVGRNQLMENEINTAYCAEHHIGIFRRSSGGGTVFTDRGCLQFSYITSKENVNQAFCDYLKMIAKMLQSLGINAYPTSRNDIMIDKKKVAGCAFYRQKNRSILHNTLLFDTDLDSLMDALVPKGEKLESKGVKSVRNYVRNIKDFTDKSIGEIAGYARDFLCDDEPIELTDKDIQAVREIEKKYLSDEFIHGKNPQHTVTRKHYFKNIGLLEARMALKNDHIAGLRIYGDFFQLDDPNPGLASLLHKVRFDRPSVEKALQDHDVSTLVRGLRNEDFLRLLFGREPHVKKPDWLKVNLDTDRQLGETSQILSKNKMHTICTDGMCPNRIECWSARTATLMIGGNICTRNCKFCNTLSGKPLPLVSDEPERVADTVKELNLRYAVITSVDRDDLPDQGAHHWKKTIESVREKNKQTIIEVLLPDFMGKKELIDEVLSAKPNVAGHNIETVKRLTPGVRSVAKYQRSLDVLRQIADNNIICKTSFMVGLGETKQEVEELMNDILATGCRILTIGQYLQPTRRHLPVAEYITPGQFGAYKQMALDKGFRFVESGPLVRSSYHAAHGFQMFRRGQ